MRQSFKLLILLITLNVFSQVNAQIELENKVVDFAIPKEAAYIDNAEKTILQWPQAGRDRLLRGFNCPQLRL